MIMLGHLGGVVVIAMLLIREPRPVGLLAAAYILIFVGLEALANLC
mgnify:FL=1